MIHFLEVIKMTILDQNSMMVSAAMTDAFGAQTPTTEAGLVRDAGQTGIFIYAKVDYTLYLKDAGGTWNEYADITADKESLTVPWGVNTAAFFKCADGAAKLHVHAKTGSILYDSTPEDNTDANNTLLASGAALATEAVPYTFPAADGADGQVLVTDGTGNLSFADQSGGGSSDAKVAMIGMSASWDFVTTGPNEKQTVPMDLVVQNSFGSDVWDVATNKFTAPETGFYYVNLSLHQNDVDNAETSQYQVRLEATGKVYGAAYNAWFPDSVSGVNITHKLDKIMHFTAGDEMWVSLRNVGIAESDSSVNHLDHVTYLGILKL